MAYRASTLRGLAIAQMVFGALMILFGIASVSAVDHWSSYTGFGLWVGAWVLITGIMGYIGAKDDINPNKCLIGCFMGFSITVCIFTGIMFICYCVALGQFNETLRCKRDHWDWDDRTYHTNTFCYSRSARHEAAVGVGLGACMLVYTIVEWCLALTSSIYCCNAVCCNATTGVVQGTTVATQQVTYIQQPQQMFNPAGQSGVVIIGANGAVTTTTHGAGYPLAAGHQPVFIPQQPAVAIQRPVVVQQPVAVQQPAYWAVPPGASPAGTVTVPYPAGAAAGSPAQFQGQVPEPPKDNERPPPYSNM